MRQEGDLSGIEAALEAGANVNAHDPYTHGACERALARPPEKEEAFNSASACYPALHARSSTFQLQQQLAHDTGRVVLLFQTKTSKKEMAYLRIDARDSLAGGWQDAQLYIFSF